jgi:peptide/nickel transport system substrate-binding protein
MRLGTLYGRAMATLGLLVGLALVGSAGAAPAGTVTFAIPSEPPTVDPAIEVAGPGYRVLLQLYEGLLEYRGNTTELGPALAQSWTVAPDGTWIELKLRPNVKFHDGSTLDAETVKASIDRTKAVNRGGAFFLTTLKEVQVVDRMTVRLVANQPSVSLLYGLPKVFITGKARLADADRGAAFFATGPTA